ncbi:MAG: ABC transporter ATP-binding protein [Vulcanibacillus sp.]
MTLKIESVTRTFGKTIAINNLSLDIPQNQIYGFLGANGAGKTTMFRLILGLLSPNLGKISWDGHPIDYSFSNQVGYLPEERGLYPKLTVKEQLLYFGQLRGMNKQAINEKLEYWLDQFHISEYLNRKLEELSKGNQQKIQFITSIINSPKLLLLDEPFSGLDPVNVELLKDAVVSIAKQGTTIVFSSHRMEHVEELCENLCILHHGNPILQGNLQEIKSTYRKKNIIIHTDLELDYLNNLNEVSKIKKINQGYIIQVTDSRILQDILKDIISKGTITKFSLEEPSLNDIFIEKVGASYE